MPSLFVSLFHPPSLPFCSPYLLLRPFYLSLSCSLPRSSSLLRGAFAKVQRRGLPVADDQRGFPFSTPCCCAAASLLSVSFSRALGSTGMIILREKIRRDLHERLSQSQCTRYRIDVGICISPDSQARQRRSLTVLIYYNFHRYTSGWYFRIDDDRFAH